MNVPAVPEPEAVVRADPSEAVRSADIVAVISERFDIVARHDCGGSLLHWILGGIAGNFTPQDPASMRCLQILFDAEDVLLESGELTSDFVVIAAQPKASTEDPGERRGNARRRWGGLAIVSGTATATGSPGRCATASARGR